MYHVTPSYTPDQIDQEFEDVEAEITSARKQLITESASSTTQLATGDNLNNYTTGGTYCVPFDSVAAGISNMPRSASGRLIVIERTSVYITQFYLPSTSAEMIYMRNYNNGTWTNWKEINQGTSTGTIAKASRVTSGTLDLASCTKTGNVVNVSGRIHTITSNTVTASGTFFVIPSGFRPPSGVTYYGSGYLNTSDGISSPLVCAIYSDGSVSLSYSSNKYASQVGFSACYPLV